MRISIRSLLEKYKNTTAPRIIILFMDNITLAAVYGIMELLRHYGYHSPKVIEIVSKGIFILGTSFFVYLGIGTHRSMIRHLGLRDVVKIMGANTAVFFLLLLFTLINNKAYFLNPRLVPSYLELLTTFSMQLTMMIGTRLALQRIFERYVIDPRTPMNIIIYGAGAAGQIATTAFRNDHQKEVKVICFIDDDVKKHKNEFNGIRVMSPKAALRPTFIKTNKIEAILLAMPDITAEHKREIIEKALELKIRVKAVPHIDHWINNSFTANQIRNINIDDLLCRAPIKLDNNNIVNEVVGKTVLVTGAAGSIGSEICRQLIQYQAEKVIMLDQAESPMYDLQFELRNNKPYCQYADRMVFVITNIKDKARMDQVFSTYKPQLVFHAAAYKHVPFMEENVYEALFVNVFGTRIVADLAIKYGTEKFVMISTDKAVRPTNVMGATKRMAEIYIQSRNTEKTRFITTRFGNVLGSNGSVIPLFKKQLASGGPLTVTDKKIIRYFMTIPEACNLVLEAGSMGEGGDIFVFDMGEPVKIYDLAKKMIQLSGLKDIQITEIGLRPGEKIKEELLAQKEDTIPTHHPKIMHAKVDKYPTDQVDKAYDELWDTLPSLDDMKLVKMMKTIVPEFVSNNSIYCQLDKKEE